jgi:hypothetical protein
MMRKSTLNQESVPVGTSGESGRRFRSARLFFSPENSLNFPNIGVVLIVSNDRILNDVERGAE